MAEPGSPEAPEPIQARAAEQPVAATLGRGTALCWGRKPDMARETTMRAVVFQQEGQPLAVEDRQTPKARPGDLVLRVACCGICGSDLHATEPSPTPLDRGTVLGFFFATATTE